MNKTIIVIGIVTIFILSTIGILYILIEKDILNVDNNSQNEFENIIFKGIAWSHDSKIALIYGEEQTFDYDYQCALYKYENDEIVRLTMPNEVLDGQVKKVEWSIDNEFALIQILVSHYGIPWGYFCVYNKEEITVLKDRSPIGTFEWNPKSSYALISADNSIYKYSNNDLEYIDRDKNLFNSIEWTNDGETAILIGEDNTILIYKDENFISASNSLPSIPNSHNWWICSLSNSNDETLLISSMGQIYILIDDEIFEINNSVQPDIIYSYWDVSWDYNNDIALIVGGDFNSGTHGSILKYENKNITQIVQNSFLQYEQVEWSKNSYALINAWKSPTIISRGSNEEINEFDESRSYGLLYKFENNVIEKISTPDLGEIGDIDYNYDKDSFIIGGALFTEGSWHTRILEYKSNNIQSFSINKKGWLNDVSWAPNNEIALVVGLLGIILKYDGTSFEDISVM